MLVKELKEIIKNLDDNVNVTIIDIDHNNCYDIIDTEVCEDRTSEFFNTYLDLVINLEG